MQKIVFKLQIMYMNVWYKMSDCQMVNSNEIKADADYVCWKFDYYLKLSSIELYYDDVDKTCCDSLYTMKRGCIVNSEKRFI